jgi:hypothetical protein
VGNSKSQLHKAKLRIREFLSQPDMPRVCVEGQGRMAENGSCKPERYTTRRASGFAKTASALG